ncbi:MAG TPA: hypothetical protein VEG68_18540 [Terriglobales bacterium]|nr:hypothetical protein [Terriglobales bacterium]
MHGYLRAAIAVSRVIPIHAPQVAWITRIRVHAEKIGKWEWQSELWIGQFCKRRQRDAVLVKAPNGILIVLGVYNIDAQAEP